jgi:urea carboxylase
VRIEEGTFKLGDYQRMLADNAEPIAEFRGRQAAAFTAERHAWERAGEFNSRPAPAVAPAPAVTVAPGGTVVEATMTGIVWKVDARPGDEVAAGQILIVLEAMKTEFAVVAPGPGVVVEVVVAPGDQVTAGGPVAILVLD